MRVYVGGIIIEDENKITTDFYHETYSMFLNNISTERARKIHEKKRFKRLFTFTRLYINDPEVHFYVSGEDEIINEFINTLMFNQLIRIGDKVINVNKIELLDDTLQEKKQYIFKSKFIVNEKEDNKVCLSKNLLYVKKRIGDIARDKYKEIYGVEINNDIEVEFINIKREFTKYKNHHINYYNAELKLRGNRKLINLIYNVGLGENTATGHGFVWEVS